MNRQLKKSVVDTDELVKMINDKVDQIIRDDIKSLGTGLQGTSNHSKLENLAFNVLEQKYSVEYVGDGKDGKPYYKLTEREPQVLTR